MDDSRQCHQRPVPAQDLPLLVQLRIFQELGPRDIALGCAGVCRSWHAAIHNEPILWRSLCRSRYSIAPPSCPSPSASASSSTSTTRTDNGVDWRSVFLARFCADRHVLRDLVAGRIQQHQYRFFQETDPIFEQIDALARLDNQAQVSSASASASASALASAAPSASVAVVAPAAADVLTHVMFTSTYAFPSIGYSAWALLRHLRWSWILQQLESPADSTPEYLWALLSAVQMLHLDPVSHVIRPLLARLDGLAQEFTQSHPSQSSDPPSHRVALLGHFLFSTKGFQGNRSNRDAPTNHYLHDLLSTQLGGQLSLCILLASVGRRLTPPLPISLMASPLSFFALVDDPAPRLTIDLDTQLLDPYSYNPSNPCAWRTPASLWSQTWTLLALVPNTPYQFAHLNARDLMRCQVNSASAALMMQWRAHKHSERHGDMLYVMELMRVRIMDRPVAPAAADAAANPGVAMHHELIAGHLIGTPHLLDLPLVMHAIRHVCPADRGEVVDEMRRTLAGCRLDRPDQFRSRHFQMPKYARGSLFVHKLEGYLAVIVEADQWCRKDDAWRMSNRDMLERLEHGTEQPWYHCVALGAFGTRYAAQEDVDVLTDRPLDEIPVHVQERVRRLLAAPGKAGGWLDVRGHGCEVKKVIVEPAGMLSDEVEQVLLVGRYFDRFDWDRWMFVSVHVAMRKPWSVSSCWTN